jgi:ABC-type glycerol-3-phosphate transport system substrate-binding protein
VQPKSSCLAPLFAALLAAGCRQEPTPTAPARPHQGALLRVACPGGPAAAVVETHARGWAARAGARVEVLRYDRPAGPGTVEAADVWVLRPAELPHWAAAGRLLPVPQPYTAREGPYGWRDLLPLYREQLLLWDRAAVGLPLLGEAPVCCYRTDLLEDAAHRKAFRQKNGWDLSPPRTWEEYAAVAEYFREHGPGGKAGPSLPPLPADEGGLDRLFYTMAAGYARRAIPADEDTSGRTAETFSFHYDLDTGRPRIDTPGFVYALRLLQRMQRCRPEGAGVPAETFRAGRAVLCVTDASWLPAFQKSAAVRDKFSVCPMPGGGRYFEFGSGKEVVVWDAQRRAANRVPYLGADGWLAVVPRGSAHPEAAFALLAHLSGPEASNEIVLEPRFGGGPIRAPQLNRQRWDAFDLAPGPTAALREALLETLLHRGVKDPALVLRIPEQASHRAALVEKLRPALTAGGGPEAALKEAARLWSELDKAKGPSAMKAEYRLSVGLLAQ